MCDPREQAIRALHVVASELMRSPDLPDLDDPKRIRLGKVAIRELMRRRNRWAIEIVRAIHLLAMEGEE